jgi:xylulokinase
VSGRVPAVLAIDVGTTSVKTGLVGLDGTFIRLARAGHELTVGHRPGWAEQDPEAWWEGVLATAADVLDGSSADVVAIAVDGHGPTLTAVDDDGNPTRPAITWLDSRSRAELDELSDASGLRGWALGVIPAALWVERNERAIADRTRWYLNTWEFIGHRLTGRAKTTIVPGQALPASPILQAAGVTPSKIAEPAPAGTVLGGLTDQAAAVLGLSPGIPVAVGVVDVFASFHGAGLLQPGDAIDAGGMAGGFGVYVSHPVEAVGSFCTPGPIDGTFVVGGAMAATGRALDWLRDDVLGGTFPIEQLLTEAEAVPPTADGLVFLPYLAGERSPIWDPSARGAFAGLTLRHGRAHLVRAVLEAAALAIRHVAAAISEAGVNIREMRVSGGPAQSPLWNQIKADVTGFTVAVPHAHETAVVGSGIIGAVAIGAYRDLREAIRAMTRIDRRLEPRPEVRDAYDRLYESYLALYPHLSAALAPLRPGPAVDEETRVRPAPAPVAGAGGASAPVGVRR